MKKKTQNNFTTLALSEETKQRINRWGHKGETHDVILDRILKIVEGNIEGSKLDFQTADKWPENPKAEEKK